MENTITTTAAQGAAKRANPIKNFISALNAKRRKAVLSLTTMVTMAMASSVSAFAEGGEGVADGEAAFNSVIGFFATWIGRIGLVVAFVGGIMFALSAAGKLPLKGAPHSHNGERLRIYAVQLKRAVAERRCILRLKPDYQQPDYLQPCFVNQCKRLYSRLPWCRQVVLGKA